jgi:hypothetical protein
MLRIPLRHIPSSFVLYTDARSRKPMEDGSIDQLTNWNRSPLIQIIGLDNGSS